MTCTNCGTSNVDTASICANCGKPLSSAPSHSYAPPPPHGSSFGAPPQAEKIPNYLLPAILTLCCCWPLAIVAIIFAAQVNSKLAAGDIAGAREASSKAKLFCWIAFGLGILSWCIWLATGGLTAFQAYRDAMASAGR